MPKTGDGHYTRGDCSPVSDPYWHHYMRDPFRPYQTRLLMILHLPGIEWTCPKCNMAV